MREELKLVGFAAMVCIVCSLALSIANSALRERQTQNVILDQKFNVLKALGVPVVDENGHKVMTGDQVNELFAKAVTTVVLDRNGAKVDVDVNSLSNEELADKDRKSRFPVYVFTDPATQERKYALHISGMGLWSTLKGYIALNSTCEKIVGLTFYEHAETPGLGAEVEQPWFLKQFPGKSVFEGGKQLPFIVAKGKAADSAPQSLNHAVDGIPGATMTSKGLERFMNKDLATYGPYLARLRRGEE
jgi:Na+-transporting NADH:ubiquinone oxidoreductase subunit C